MNNIQAKSDLLKHYQFYERILRENLSFVKFLNILLFLDEERKTLRK